MFSVLIIISLIFLCQGPFDKKSSFVYLLARCVANNNHYLNYRKVSNIRRAKSQNLNVSHLDLQLSLRNIMRPSVKWRMKM